MLHNLWQRLFSNFIKKYHIQHLFERHRSFKELHQASYASEISKKLSQSLINASYVASEQLLNHLNTTEQGLSAKQVEQRQEQFGLNELAHEKPLPWWKHLWYAYRNPFNILLTILALVAFFTDDIEGTIIITTMVVLSTVLRYWQEFKSNKAAAALKAMVSNTATVIRQVDWDDPDLETMQYDLDQGSQQVELAIQDLVPGDIILLSAGDMIPADCRIIFAKDLFVSQASMTGESIPVEKFADQKDHTLQNALELENIVFMGTNIVSGSAKAVVVNTGTQTYFGALAHRVSHADRATTSFQMGVNKVSWLLIRFMLIMAPVVLFINGFTKGDWSEALLFALSVAVGLTPEMLPMIVTSTLAKGAVFLSRKKVIVKRLDAIQNFGAMDVLCTDKTGTLTEDKICLSQHVDVNGKTSQRVLVQNLLYDVSQIAIPFDNVDDELIEKPQSWKPNEIGRFMIFFGPLSSIFDILTFALMWFVFHANSPEQQTLFQSGWFVVGLLTQTIIVHMIRTEKIPFIQSRAAMPLIVMTLVIVAAGIFLPMGPFAEYLKLQALPLTYFLFLPFILLGYMLVVQLMKKIYIRRYGW